MKRSGVPWQIIRRAGLALLLLATPALAVQPDEILKDPALEARARSISSELRCLVCQNQSIDDSDAPLAKDLRILIRDRLKAGDGDSQVVDYVVARYGDFVLLKPRFTSQTWLLWLSPFAILLAAVLYMIGRRRSRHAAQEDSLSPADRAELDSISK